MMRDSFDNTLPVRRMVAQALVVGALFAWGCGARAVRSNVDSQSHWLDPCRTDRDCGALTCLCGLCSQLCSSAADCGVKGTCSVPSAGSCPGLAGVQGVCVADCGGQLCVTAGTLAPPTGGASGGPSLDLGTPAAASDNAPDGGLVCTGTNIDPATDEVGVEPADCLVADVTTDGSPGDYDRNGTHYNGGAIWIENDQGDYATALELWGAKWPLQQRTHWLFDRRRVACSDDPDVIATATRQQHEQHRLVWKCNDTTGQVVPDGNYLLWLEVEVDERHPQQPVTFPFVKGTTAWTMDYPSTAISKAVTLSYTPIE